MRSRTAGHSRHLWWMLCFVALAGASQVAGQDTKTNDLKTGALKDGEKCEKLPCTCGNVEATKVGQICHIDENLGPASGTWTNPRTFPITWIIIAAVVLLLILLVIRGKSKPRNDIAGGAGRT